MKLIGSTVYEGKQYNITDVKKFLKPSDLGLDTNYYGGRIKRIGTLKLKGVYLLLDAFSEEFDILIVEEELVVLKNQDGEEINGSEEVPSVETDLFQLTNKELKAILEDNGVEYDDKAVKKELVALIEGELVALFSKGD